MLTYLSVEKAKGLNCFIKGDKVFTEVKSNAGLNLRYIRYVYRRKIRWSKIVKAAGVEAGRILCSPDVKPDIHQGLRRFESDELKVRMCVNMGIEILRLMSCVPRTFTIGIYDPDGRIADSVGLFLKKVSSVVAVSRDADVYYAEAERILHESGAVLTVSKRLKSLSMANLLIAPTCINTVLPLGREAVVLTIAQPEAAQKCQVYYNYFFEVDEQIQKIKPDELSSEYMASALYTLCGRFDLGSVTPEAVKGLGSAHTTLSLAKYLTNIAVAS